ncbi:MAG: diacylglycerol/lipid kinase family protein [Fusicatenibacter sp.]|nr:diacylglycerol kinase family lipid kinase [Fusicatenibacter sp.]
MYHIIVNARSRSGYGEKIWQRIRHRLILEKIPFCEYQTRCRLDARKISAALTSKENWREEDVLVVLGGDGTVNEAVDGICQPSRVRFGYIPTGSGNDFARGTGLCTDADEALDAILRGHEMRIDIGRVDFSGEQTRRFLISSGIGYDAAICHEALSSKIKDALNQFHLGKLTYCMIALRQLFALNPFTISLMGEDGNTKTYEKALFAVAMNLPYEGGGFRFCPEADFSDGLLDVMVVSSLDKWRICYLLPVALFGKHTGFPQIHMQKCRRISWKTDSAQCVHLDGESGGRRCQMTLEIEKEQLRLLGGCADRKERK